MLHEGDVAICRLSHVEVASALCRKAREGAFGVSDRERALSALEDDVSRFYVVELTRDVARQAHDLLTRFPLRAGDSVQLASCLYLRNRSGVSLRFVAYDVRLNDAARDLGLDVLE